MATLAGGEHTVLRLQLIFDNLVGKKSHHSDSHSSSASRRGGSLVEVNESQARALESELSSAVPQVGNCEKLSSKVLRFLCFSHGNMSGGREQCGQATKGVWGMSWHQKAEGRGRLRKARGSCQTSIDPEIPVPTRGTETSQYPEEKKAKATP